MESSPASTPPPLVKLTSDPVRWLRNQGELLIAAVVLAHIGTLIVVALYYLIFEVNPTMTSWWHRTISDSALRHNIRSVGEGLLGGFLAQQVVWNHYKKKLNRNVTKLDRAEMAVRIPNVHDRRGLSVGEVLTAPVFAILYALPGFIAGYFIVRWTHTQPHPHHALQPFNAVHSNVTRRTISLWDRTRTIWTQGWPQKAMGLGASFFFGRRPVRGVFDDVQLWFAERRVATNRPLRWYHPPTFKARYNSLASEAAHAEVNHGLISALMLSLVSVGVVLAAYGWYVLTYIAQ